MSEVNPPGDNLLSASGKDEAPLERRKSRKRVKNDRRRKVERQVGLEISPCGIYLAIVEHEASSGDRTLITRHVPFPEGAPPTQGDWSDGSLTPMLSELVDEYQLAGQGVVVGLGGNPCLTRVVMGANEDVENDAAEVAERSRRYIGMGHGEKVSCRSEYRLDAKRKRAWITVAMRDAVDAVADAVEASGLRLSRLEHSMIVLCRVLSAHGEDHDQPVLLVTDEDGRIDLGISYRGQLLLDYRPAMSETDDTDGNVIERHTKCLLRYLESQLGDAFTELTNVFLTGNDDWIKVIQRGLDESSDLKIADFPIAALTEGLNLEGQLSHEPGMITAAWLARHECADDSLATPGDLMSTVRSNRKIPWGPLAAQLWPLAAAALLSAVLFGYGKYEQMQCAALQDQYTALSPDRLEAKRLRFELQKREKYDKQVVTLSKHVSMPQWNQILIQSGKLLPKGTWLETVRIDHGPVISIVGTSFTDEAIYEYMGALRECGLFHRVALESTNSTRINSGPAYQFEIHADVFKTANARRTDDLAKNAVGSNGNG